MSLNANMAFADMPGGLSYPNVLTLGTLFAIVYILITVVYRLYFHPLAKFPGPFWAKLSTFPAWWHSKNQDRHLWHLSLQEQYGMFPMEDRRNTRPKLMNRPGISLRTKQRLPQYSFSVQAHLWTQG